MRPRLPALPLREVAQARFAALDGLGLTNGQTLHERIWSLSTPDLQALRYAVFDTAKATVDTLRAFAGASVSPTAIWTDSPRPLDVIRNTMLWADHYLCADPLFESLCREEPLAASLETCIRAQLTMRKLLELGVLVPVSEDIATVITNDVVMRSTDQDLQNTTLTAWLMDELIIEGPTAREAVFVRARDGDHDEMFFLYGRIDPNPLSGEEGTFSTTLLGQYDPAHDYTPWIGSCRRQAAARFLQNVNRNAAVAEALGGRCVTTSPFRARILRRRGATPSPPGSAVWASVPCFAETDSGRLAAIVQEDDVVESLRESVRRAFARLEGLDPYRQVEGIEEMSTELAEASRHLERQIRSERRWSLLVPSMLTIGSIGLATTAGGPAIASAVLGAAASFAPYVALAQARKANPAFALLLSQDRHR